MSEVGALSLWAAGPLMVAAGVMCIAAGWVGRRELGDVGGRLVEGAAVLVLIAVVGLGYALVNVQLEFTYVAANSGFQLSPAWRMAALWSAPPGGALVLVFLIAAAAVVSHRLGATRQTSTRTGSLAVLASVGMLLVMTRARPFAQPEFPATVGLGLPLAVRDVTWQLELWAVFLATAFAAFTFAGVVGGQLAESPGPWGRERRAASFACGFLGLAAALAAWRAYVGGGELLSRGALLNVLAPGAAWFVAIAYLHAPGGAGAPAWAVRWRRVLAVALFPSTLGAAGAVLAAGGGSPLATVWTSGLAVGLISGAIAGMSRPQSGGLRMEDVPGYGSYALLGGLVALAFAGMAGLGSLLPRIRWSVIALPAAVLGLGTLCVWLLSRPVGGRSLARPRLAALAAGGGLAALGAYLLTERAIAFALVSGLVVIALAGFAPEALRLRRARPGAGKKFSEDERPMWESRTSRRLASLLAHLGAAILLLGLSASSVARSSTKVVAPGDTVALTSDGPSRVRATYLGLSRYQVSSQDITAASFMLYRGERSPQLVSAEVAYDLVSRRTTHTPALTRGVLADVFVSLGNKGENDNVTATISATPLSNLIWLGALLLILSTLAAGRSETAAGSEQARGS